jgi:general secretion pathway protein F
MPSFQYKAIAPNGDLLQGLMDAVSAEEVVAKLQEQGNLPVEAKPAEAGGAGNLLALFRGGGISDSEITEFTQQMAILLGAGLPLDRALTLQVDLAPNDRVRRLMERIRDRVRSGSSLSDALDTQGGVFDRLFVNMVRAGEVGGSLDQTLARLGDYLKRSRELKAAVVTALIYPIILLLLAGGSLVLVLVYVVPKLSPIFAEMGSDLPLMTQFVLALAAALRYGWWVMLAVVFGAVFWYRRAIADPVQRLAIHERWLRLPGIGDLITKMETARFARTAGTLQRNGVPLLSTLAIARNVVHNAVLAEAVEDAGKQVKTGGGLAPALSKTKRFPKLALQMITVGEETGQLDEMLLKIADAYDLQVRTTVDRLLAMLVPLLTILIAGFIALIVISMVMAILSMNDMVG